MVANEKRDVALSILEMSIHGHKVADEAIIATARHRNIPTRWDTTMLTMHSMKVCMDFCLLADIRVPLLRSIEISLKVYIFLEKEPCPKALYNYLN